MKRLSLLLIYALMLTLLVSFTYAANVPLNVQGTISGTCASSATVNVYGYCPGQIGNASCSIDNATVTASATGTYGTSLTYDNAVYVTGIDVLIEATNATCATSAYGNTTATNQVGGGLPVTINAVISNVFTLDTPINGSTVTNQTIDFAWTNNIVTPNSTVQIDDDFAFGSIDETQSNIASSSTSMSTSLSDGVYYWRVLTYIGGTLIQQSSVSNFTMANSTPSIINITPDNTTWIATSSTVLNLTTDTAANCSYATSSGVSFGSKTLFSSTGGTFHTTTVPLGSNGVNTLYLQCKGTNGNVMPLDTQTSLYRDTANPLASGATVSVDSGAAFSASSTINVSWSGFSDAHSGITGYYVNTTNNQGTTTGVFTTDTSSLLMNVADGSITAYVWALDEAGNIGSAASDSITVDTTAPTYGSWSTSPVNINMFTTSSVTVFVTVSDSSSLPTVPQLRYRIGSDAYTAAADMTLVGGAVYSFTIPNQASPNDWASRAGENLSYVVNATDATGLTSSETESIFINDMFTTPVFSPIVSFSALQGTSNSFILRGFDADGDTLTYSANDSSISFTAINASDSYGYWNPTNDDVGSNIIIFTVTDGYFNSSQAVIINVTDTNDDPSFTTIPALTAYEYVEFTYDINATDPDGDALLFSTNSSLFVISSSGNILFTPIAINRGVHPIEYVVSDGNGGTDTTNSTLTVLYCGDSVCSTTYESSNTCSLDCENEDESQGFIIGSKTCLGEPLTIRAVELLPRGDCSSKGTIINGWESCANMSETTITVEQDIQDEYVVVTTLITDEFGVATFRTNESGGYRLRYDSADFDENIEYFTIRECSNTQSSSSSTSQSAVESESELTEPEVNLPFFEDPLTDEQIVQLSKTTKILYFMLLPFLFILIVAAGATTYYRYDKNKGSGSFSKEIDALLIKINNQLLAITAKVRESKFYQQLASQLSVVTGQFSDVKKAALKKMEPYVKTKNLDVPFHAHHMGKLSQTQLLLQSIYEYYFKSKNSDNFIKALQREPLFQFKNLRIFALNVHKLGLPLHYLFSATKDKEELLLMHEKFPVQKSYPTLTDIKVELLKGHIVAVSLQMNALNKAAPDENFIALLTGYNKEGYFMLDYAFSRKKRTFIPTGVLQHAWAKSSYLECIIIKK